MGHCYSTPFWWHRIVIKSTPVFVHILHGDSDGSCYIAKWYMQTEGLFELKIGWLKHRMNWCSRRIKEFWCIFYPETMCIFVVVWRLLMTPRICLYYCYGNAQMLPVDAPMCFRHIKEFCCIFYPDTCVEKKPCVFFVIIWRLLITPRIYVYCCYGNAQNVFGGGTNYYRTYKI